LRAFFDLLAGWFYCGFAAVSYLKVGRAEPYITQKAKNYFLHFSHLSQAKTDFLNSMPFKLGQNRLPQFQAMPVISKLANYKVVC
jgi:hypothetical protein